MELRLTHLLEIDPTLKRYLQRAAEDLLAHPDVFLANVRGIVNHVFELIWEAELPDKRIPSEWMAIWNCNEERGGLEKWKTTFPQGGQRVRLLNLMTGTDKSVPCAKFISKSTYVLMNAAYSFGDLGAHQEGETIDPGTAYAALQLCIELAASVTRELAVDTNGSFGSRGLNSYGTGGLLGELRYSASNVLPRGQRPDSQTTDL